MTDFDTLNRLQAEKNNSSARRETNHKSITHTGDIPYHADVSVLMYVPGKEYKQSASLIVIEVDQS